MNQCIICSIPAQNKKCDHFTGPNHDLSKTEKGRKELQELLA